MLLAANVAAPARLPYHRARLAERPDPKRTLPEAPNRNAFSHNLDQAER